MNAPLERILVWLFPTLLLDGTPWQQSWREKETRENVVLWRFVFPTIGIIYVGHLVYFDIPMNLEPRDLWVQFRLSVFALCTAAFLFYLCPSLYRSSAYRIPVFFVCWVLCYTQALTAVWYEESQYLYAFLFVAVSAAIIRASMFMSMAFSGFTLSTQWFPLLEAGVSPRVLYSGVVATLLFVYVSRSSYLNEIRYFLANQQNLESQKRFIQLNIEFTDRIRAFLPHEISKRLTRRLEENSGTVLDAVDEVLRPEEREVACLFSDIRGFTRGTKQSLAYVEGVIPNVKKCTALIERSAGVPRKIGDLIFAYFDDPNPYVNIIRCVSAGLSLIEANQRLNQDTAIDRLVSRYVLISSGTAIVGNIGGYDSSTEITALGSPVNLLSRIDEITKTQQFRKVGAESDLILCDFTASQLNRLGLGVEIHPVSLRSLGVTIRDFEEIETIWLVPAHQSNCNLIWEAERHIDETYGSEERIRN